MFHKQGAKLVFAAFAAIVVPTQNTRATMIVLLINGPLAFGD